MEGEQSKRNYQSVSAFYEVAAHAQLDPRVREIEDQGKRNKVYEKISGIYDRITGDQSGIETCQLLEDDNADEGVNLNLFSLIIIRSFVICCLSMNVLLHHQCNFCLYYYNFRAVHLRMRATWRLLAPKRKRKTHAMKLTTSKLISTRRKVEFRRLLKKWKGFVKATSTLKSIHPLTDILIS